MLISLLLNGCLSQFDIFDSSLTLADVKSKVESGGVINDQNANGKTFLLVGVEEENVAIVNYLLDNGADANIVDKKGFSPLIRAAQKANFTIIKKLIDNGADINYQMPDKTFALYELIGNQDIHSSKDYVKMAKYFVEHGADIRLVGFNNYSIMHACRDVKMIEYLISLGMSIHDVSENNATTLVGSIANKGEGTAVTEYYINNCVDLKREATFDDVSANAYTMALKFKRFDSAKLILDAMNNPPRKCTDNNSSVVPPLIEFYGLSETIDAQHRDVAVELKAQGFGIGESRVFLNDVELDDNKRLRVIKDENGTKIFNITLNEGLNEIKVYAYDIEDEVRSHAIFHTFIGDDKVDVRSNLYAVVVGIDSFEATQIDLKYARSDALLFGSTLFKRARELFSNVEIIYLKTDKETTKESILNELKSLQNISKNDLFVFYAATLGTTIEHKYYMLTSDIVSIDNTYLKENALSEDELRNAFKRIPAQNQLLLFDTSYSGSTSESISEKLVANSQRELNLNSVAATGTTEITLEGYTDGHSVFAYVLSDALDGAADANNDGIVNSHEMLHYVVNMVPKEASRYKHTQTPTFYESGEIFDIAKMRYYTQEVKVYIEKKVACSKPEELQLKPQLLQKKTQEKKSIKPTENLEKNFRIGKLKFSFKDDSIFINTKDELKSHFSFVNAQGETLVVFDFFSDRDVSYAMKEVETNKVTKLEIGNHEGYYRVVLHTKIKQWYEYIISDSGIQIKLKN